MPLLDKCEKCERERGYAVHENDTVCARCAQPSEPEADENAPLQNNNNDQNT